MLHVRRMVESFRSKGKSYDAKNGWMNDRLRECSLILVRGEDC